MAANFKVSTCLVFSSTSEKINENRKLNKEPEMTEDLLRWNEMKLPTTIHTQKIIQKHTHMKVNIHGPKPTDYSIHLVNIEEQKSCTKKRNEKNEGYKSTDSTRIWTKEAQMRCKLLFTLNSSVWLWLHTVQNFICWEKDMHTYIHMMVIRYIMVIHYTANFGFFGYFISNL